MSYPTFRQRQAAVFVIVLLVSFVGFGAVLPGEPVVDDKLWIPAATASADQQPIMNLIGGWVFRPLHTLLVRQVHGILGGSVALWHVLSILLHAINGFLLYLLLRRLAPRAPIYGALLLTFVFILHPAGSEAVLWISAMSELTVTFTLLVSFHFFITWRESWTVARLMSIAIMVLAACLFKETAIAFPFAILLFELAGGKGWRASLKPFAAMMVSVVAFLLLRQWALGSATGGQSLAPNLTRVAELLLAHLRFLWLPAAPPFALRPPEVALTSGSALAVAMLLLTGVLVAAFYLKASRALVALGLAWGGLMLWPAFAVAIVGEGFFNGRQAYPASIGIPILLAALWTELPSTQRVGGAVVFAGALAWMLYSTIENALVWRTNVGVYSQSMALSPSAAGPRAGIADSLAQAGNVDGAVEMFSGAATRAGNAREKAGYLYAIGQLLGQVGRIRESNLYLGQVIALDPGHSHALTGLGNNAWIAGQLGEAENFYRRAISANPGNAEAISNLQRLRSAQ